MSQFPMTNQWAPQQWGVYQGAQTAPQWGAAPQAAPQWDMQRMAQDPQYAQLLQRMRQMQSAQAPQSTQAPQSGGLMGQQWPGQQGSPLGAAPPWPGQLQPGQGGTSGPFIGPPRGPEGPFRQWPGQQGGPWQKPTQPSYPYGIMQSNSAPALGGLTGQQSGGASWPGGLTGTQSNYPWWGGPFQTPSVNGSTYTDMPAYNMPNWFNNAPWDVTQWQNMTPEQLQATVAFNEMAMPWTQMAQNYQQWQNEFNQNAYQWGNEFDWKKTGDQFAMDLSTRQQDTSESQWGSEFGLKTREQDDLNKWRDTQTTLEREKMVTDQENAALASWGRKMRPNTRWM